MKMEFSAGGVIYRQNTDKIEFALILDSYDKWTFPKGHIENREPPETAALREVNEELGIEAKIIELLGKIDYWFKQDGELIHKFVYFYLMEASTEASLSPQLEEIKDAKWLIPEEAVKRLDYRKDDLPLLTNAFGKLNLKMTDFKLA